MNTVTILVSGVIIVAYGVALIRPTKALFQKVKKINGKNTIEVRPNDVSILRFVVVVSWLTVLVTLARLGFDLYSMKTFK